MQQTKKHLPIGIQTFREIRDGDYYYVDKTAYACQLAGQGKYFFLSRPRRFGKSLFLDTLKELFEGNCELFSGLIAENEWDWSQRYPVIRISFGSGVVRDRQELEMRIRQLLTDTRTRLELPPSQVEKQDITGQFIELISQAYEQHGNKVVVLIDEYDKPILDNIEDSEQAAKLREGLKNLYSVLKDADPWLRFALLTGVSKFSKVSLFSGINNLHDLTLIPKFSAICGYTEHDVDTIFAPELEKLDRQQIREWYNGYNWGGESVYNPFDLLLLFADRQFRFYWFESGSPSFLIKLFQQQKVFLPMLADIEVDETILDSFDLERIEPITLLFQAGYLTIDKINIDELGEISYALRVPNREVASALNSHFIGSYAELHSLRKVQRSRLFRCLNSGDLPALQQEIQAVFAAIPWRNFCHDLPQTEGYYASVLYAFFASLHAMVIPEDISNQGQADMTIMLGEYIYVMELKRDTRTEYQVTAENPALKQIIERNYADKYRASGKRVFQVGLIFNTHARNLVQMDWI